MTLLITRGSVGVLQKAPYFGAGRGEPGVRPPGRSRAELSAWTG
jgi:hypothetical protein